MQSQVSNRLGYETKVLNVKEEKNQPCQHIGKIE